MKIPFILKHLPKIQAYFENLKYSEHFQTYISFNVKMSDTLMIDTRDLPDILKDKCTDELKAFLLNRITGKMISQQWNYWCDDLREDFREFISGINCTDEKIKRHVSLFDHSEIYYLGRSGGHLCLAPFAEIEDQIDECFIACDDLEDSEAYEIFVDVWKYYKAVQFIEAHVKEVLKNNKANFMRRLCTNFTDAGFLEYLGFVSEDQQIEMKLQAIAV